MPPVLPLSLFKKYGSAIGVEIGVLCKFQGLRKKNPLQTMQGRNHIIRATAMKPFYDVLFFYQAFLQGSGQGVLFAGYRFLV